MKIADVDFNIAPGGSGRSKYEQGVSLEMSPLFDFYKEPWVLLKHLVRELTVAHLAVKYTDMELLPRNLTLVDAGCGFCELSALLKRARKVGGFRLDYIGIDIDEDKQRVSKLIDKDVDFRIHDLRDLKMFTPRSVECVVLNGVLEHFLKPDGEMVLEQLTSILSLDGIFILDYATPTSRLRRNNKFHLYEWTNEEVRDSLEKLGYEILDDFCLAVPEKDWDIHDDRFDRIPQELVRAVASVLSTSEGNDGITIARRLT